MIVAGKSIDLYQPPDLANLISEVLSPPAWISFERLAQIQHMAAWTDVAAKAKRLVQNNQVTILRNAPHHVMGHVVGDHGEYNTEISRHDPTSQIIEQWNCECPWAQYAFDRTRKWKKLEGRVCSHVLGTYWKAKSTPLDMAGQDEGFQAPSGQVPGAAPGQDMLPGMVTPQPQGAPQPPMPPAPGQAPSQPLQPSKDLVTGPQPKSPLTQPPQTQTPVVPQREQLQLFDITAPPGGQPVPGATPVSIPGGRPPTPGNPVQFPGTFSHFVPVMTVHSNFIYGNDKITDYFATLQAMRQPMYVKLKTMVALELSGGKVPLPGAQPYDVSKEGVPLYNVMDLGYNPVTGLRENADVNQLQGAPEQTGTYADVPAGRRAEVIDYDPNMKMAYIVVPLNYPEGGDIRLHPHSLKGWVEFSDIEIPDNQLNNPWRQPR